jgi:hypothetical protein
MRDCVGSMGLVDLNAITGALAQLVEQRTENPRSVVRFHEAPLKT